MANISALETKTLINFSNNVSSVSCDASTTDESNITIIKILYNLDIYIFLVSVLKVFGIEILFNSIEICLHLRLESNSILKNKKPLEKYP